MEILHQLGHNKKWNIDAYNFNDIGQGFIYGAYNTEYEKILNLDKKLIDISLIDLQYYGKSTSGLGKLETYPFHPACCLEKGETITDGVINIIDGIKFQENLGIERIIIPNYFYPDKINNIIKIVKDINDYLIKNRRSDSQYFMTIPLSDKFILDEDDINSLLTSLTDMKIVFNGYYIVCEGNPSYKQKIDIKFDYLENLSKVFTTLKSQRFLTIYGYANWDSIIFLSLTDIDYVTIGTYENLRNFSHVRYSEKIPGGPSDGWYFSEKLLNFIRARELTSLRRNNSLSLVGNDLNIFSDAILQPEYDWNTHKPEVHKNYLLSISRLLEKISNFGGKLERINYCIEEIDSARNVYRELADRRVFLPDESDDYHLGAWSSFLRSKI